MRYDMLAQVLVLELSRISGTTLPFQNDFLQLRVTRSVCQPAQTDPIRMEYQHRRAFGVRIRGIRAFRRLGYHEHEHARAHRRHSADHERWLFVNNGEYAPALLVAPSMKMRRNQVGMRRCPSWMILLYSASRQYRKIRSDRRCFRSRIFNSITCGWMKAGGCQGLPGASLSCSPFSNMAVFSLCDGVGFGSSCYG